MVFAVKCCLGFSIGDTESIKYFRGLFKVVTIGKLGACDENGETWT